VTVKLVVALTMLLLVDAAVTCTAPLPGTAAGAVYVAATPLAVCAVIVPHVPAAQLTVQSTPALDTSFATSAVRRSVSLTTTDWLAAVTDTEIGRIEILPLTDFVGSVTDVAVTTTEPPVGTLAGAVYVVATPLAVCAGLKVPHELDPQATVHCTPPFAKSLVRTAFSEAVPLTGRDAGGAGAKAIEIGGARMVSVTVEYFE
jgi:hypothetical protein